MKRILLYTFSILLSLSAGGIGSYFTFDAISTWYVTLSKPFFNPPNWLFGPVWTLLYILMGIAFARIWESKHTKQKKTAIYYFLIQLVLNALWSILFFGLKNLTLAFVEIMAMWIMIYLTIKTFATIDKTASYLLYPYLAWVSFASLLNLSLAILNR